jgi:hypothetical protein
MNAKPVKKLSLTAAGDLEVPDWASFNVKLLWVNGLAFSSLKASKTRR